MLSIRPPTKYDNHICLQTTTLWCDSLDPIQLVVVIRLWDIWPNQIRASGCLHCCADSTINYIASLANSIIHLQMGHYLTDIWPYWMLQINLWTLMSFVCCETLATTETRLVQIPLVFQLVFKWEHMLTYVTQGKHMVYIRMSCLVIRLSLIIQKHL